MDEPMSGLDPVGRREVRNLIEQLRQDGHTVIFSTHILADAEALCDRVGILDAGELCGIGAVSDLAGGLSGGVEIQWQGLRVPAGLNRFTAEYRHVGNTVRAVVGDEHQDLVLDSLRQEGLHIVSVTPVRASLEDYFLRHLHSPQPSLRAEI